MSDSGIRRIARAFSREAARVPTVRTLLDSSYGRRFNRAAGAIRLFRGIYADFAGATQDIPSDRLQGYDNEASALRLADDRMRIYPFDYPVMFWLHKLFPGNHLLFDFGGHVGISYFAYRRYLDYPASLRWLVYDLPSITKVGREIATREVCPGLAFTEGLEALGQAHILLAAGALQFVENAYALMRSAPALPRHILVNKLPAVNLPARVTLHNLGSALCPHHLFNRAEFVSCFTGLGYRLVDEWQCPDISCEIPYFPEYSVPAYTGFYFLREH